jgi:alkanesulfonate monooxygenase SsuD/methylene tetrahydromethanopterin reductase-like flavin-dependent oxidoreductase (luciferase family)
MLDRIVHSGGWIAPPMEPARAERDWASIREHAESEGVDPAGLDRVLLNYTHLVDTDDREAAHEEQAAAFAEFFSPNRGFDHARDTCLVGTPEDIRARLGAYEDAGFDQVIAGPAAHEPAALDAQMTLLVEHVLDAWD